MTEQHLTQPVQENRDKWVFPEVPNEVQREATAQWEGYNLAILDAVHDPWTNRLATLDLPPPTHWTEQRLPPEE